MKKRHKRAGAIILAAALMTSAVSPLSVLAGETVKEQTAIQEEVKTEESAGTENNMTSEGVKESVSEAGKESVESETEAEAGKASVESETEAEAGKASAESETEAEAGKASAESETEATEGISESGKADENYDTTKPVIEKVTLEKNGQTLKPGDNVKVLIEAYDTGSGIAEVNAELTLGAQGQGYSVSYMEVTHKEGNLYEATYQLPEDTTLTEGYINCIRVKDNKSNYIEAKVFDNSGYLYRFAIEPAEAKVYVVSDFKFDGQGKTYVHGDTLKLSYVLEGQEEAYKGRSMSVVFQKPDETTGFFDAEYNYETGRYEVSESIRVYNGVAGKWQLKSVISDWTGGTTSHDISNVGVVWFNAEQGDVDEGNKDDRESPKITAIELSHNTEFVEPGMSLTLSVKAEDNVELNKDNVYAHFSAVQDGIQNDYIYVDLSYNEENDTFVGTFEVTEETYPCEWMLSSVNISDMAGNYPNLVEGLDYTSYYVRVKNGDTFVNPDIDVTVNFYALNEVGELDEISTVTKTVPRRTTLKEAGIEFPTPTAAYKGVKFKGWLDYLNAGKPIDENRQLLGNESIYYYATYDYIPACVSYKYLNRDGQWVYADDEKLFPENTTVGEVYKSMAEYPAPSETPNGFKFKEWYAAPENPDAPATIWETWIMYALYEEGVGEFSYSYMDENNNWKTVERTVPLDKASTEEAVIEEAKKHHEADETKDLKFSGWKVTRQHGTLENGMNVEFEAVYEDGKIVTSKAYYNDESGRDAVVEKSFVVKEGTTYGEIKQKMEADLAENKPKMHKDLRFESWYCETGKEDDVIIYDNHWEAEYYAQYENCIDRFYVYDSEDAAWEVMMNWNLVKQSDAFTYIISEKGEKVIAPTEIGGYTNLKVINDETMMPGKEFTAYGFSWVLTGDKIGTDPEKPTDPENPTDPEKPTNPEKPATELPQDFIDKQVDKLNRGESVQINMGEATVVPEEMLLAAKGKDVTITLDMGGYTWTINGKDIHANLLQDINLEVKMDSNAIPDSTVKKLAGDNPARQLSLTHNGPFGFKALLTVNVGSEYAGRFGNLYYHDSDGKMVYRNAGKVDGNGNVTLSFDHASDYVIVLANKQMSQSDVPSSLQPGNPNNGNNANKPVKTGDTASILMFVALAILSAATAAAVFIHKRKRA